MIKKLFSSQLRINMASSVATHCVNIVVLAVTYPIYLHYLGYETYGVWLALGVVLAFARLSDLGMAQAVTKLVAEECGALVLRSNNNFGGDIGNETRSLR
ncbi:MAG: hypothetical protein HQ580_13455 [Planctomycetes bacterium]|nr:hypothetical protein [Planctomycetota bacterium]